MFDLFAGKPSGTEPDARSHSTFCAKQKLKSCLGSITKLFQSGHGRGSPLPTLVCKCNTVGQLETCLRLADARGMRFRIELTGLSSPRALEKEVVVRIQDLPVEMEFAEDLVIEWQLGTREA